MSKPINMSFVRSYLSGVSPAPQKIKSFLGQQHKLHCKYVLGEECANVHSRIDRRLGGGRNHRINDHNVPFVIKSFKQRKEVRAAYIHLIGDLVSDILPEVLKKTIREMERKGVIAPSFVIANGRKQWDIKPKAMESLTQNIMRSVIVSLHVRNRLK